MTKKFKAKLIMQLHELAPSVPSRPSDKGRSTLVKELIQLAPEKPIITVSGIELVNQLIIPSSPNQKNGTERPNFKK